MKKIIIFFLLAPAFLFAQNPMDVKAKRNPNGKIPNIESEVIDGRNSSLPSFWTPISFASPELLDKTPLKYRILKEPISGLPIQLKVYTKEASTGFGVNETNEDFAPAKVLADLPALFEWDNDAFHLVKYAENTDELGYTHIRYQQYVNDLPVHGGQWILHVQNGSVISGNGRIYPSTSAQFQTSLTLNEAQTLAENHIYNQVKAYQAPGAYGVHLNRTTKTELVVEYELTETLDPKLVYLVDVRPTDMYHYKVYVDGHTGEIIKTIDELCEIDGPKVATATDLNNQSRSINTYQKGSTYYMIDASKSMWTNSQPSSFPDNPLGAIWTIDAQNTQATSIYHITSTNNAWSDKSAVSAHYNAGLAFDYYKNTHGRNSINGSGGSIISVVNVQDEGGAMDNAYWNGQAMFYGNGATAFKPLAGALDVAGHELTHGVVSNSANLEYQGQSGAINESMADVFGAMIDRDDWKIGEDIVKSGVFAGGALRDLSNPHNGGSSLNSNGYQPEKMSEYYTGTQDNGGVHINSGIVNRAFYLSATGSTMSKEKAEKIWYRALTQYLTSKSQFLDLRYACVNAAQDIYNGTEETDAVAAIKNAFDVVQIYDPNGGTGGGTGGSGSQDDIPANTGTENIISLDVNTQNANTWYKSSTVPDAYVALTTVSPLRKCSVTDKGDYMFYIDTDNSLRRIQLTSPYTEDILSNDDWNNVAISKDGKRLAAITTLEDGRIYVYDFITEVWKVFVLYNPTYTQGVDAGNVNFADAIEFDNTGEFLLYDAQNEITNSSGGSISWWDLGILRVWDNQSNSFGDGKIEKVYSQLPTGVSIGNATYAKNSPYIIAFDYITASSYSVVAANTITGKSNTLITHDILGFPNFSNKDDKIIFDAQTTGGAEVLAVVQLDATKIATKTGTNAAVLIEDGKWGTWYANGTRNLLSDKKDITSFSFPNLPGSPEGIFSGTTITVNVATGTNLTALIPTFVYSADATVTVNNANQISGVTVNNYTNTVTYKVTAQDGTSKNYQVVVNLVAGVPELQKAIAVYPNPACNTVHIASTIPIKNVQCFTINGAQVLAPFANNAVDLSQFQSGIYFIQIETTQGTITKRITKI